MKKEKLKKIKYQQFKKEHKKIKKEVALLKKSVHGKTNAWIEKGKQYINPDKVIEWERWVNIGLNEMFSEKELATSLLLISALNNGASFEKVKTICINQNNQSYNMVRAIVKVFCDQGVEFFNAIESKDSKQDLT